MAVQKYDVINWRRSQRSGHCRLLGQRGLDNLIATYDITPIKDLEQAGADRVIISLDTFEGNKALQVMEEIAGQVLV